MPSECHDDCLFRQKTPTQILADAKTGSLRDMEELAGHIDKMPQTMVESVLNMYLTFFRKPPFYQPNSSRRTKKRVEPSQDDLLLVYFSMTCMAGADIGVSIKDGVESKRLGGGRLRAMVLNDWRIIRRWLQYMSSEIGIIIWLLDQGDTSYEQRKQYVCTMICAFLYTLGEDSVLREMLRRDPLVFLCVQCLWLYQGVDDLDKDVPIHYRNDWRPLTVSLLYGSLLRNVDDEIKSTILKGFAENEVYEYALVDCALKRVRLASKRLGLEGTAGNMGTYTEILWLIAAANKGVLIETVADGMGTTVIIKALRKYLDYVALHLQDTIIDEEESTHKALMYFAGLLDRMFMLKRSDIRMKVALRRGLLPVLAKYMTLVVARRVSHQSSDDDLAKAYDTILSFAFSILDAVTRCTLYRTVVDKIADGIEDIEETGELDTVLAIGGNVRKAWTTLRQLTLERSICKALSDTAVYSRERKCEGCGEKFPSFDLKTCAGCKMASYCSKKCQTTMWRMPGREHRSECQKRLEKKKQQDLLAGKNDMRFITDIAMADIRRHFASIKVLAIRTFPDLGNHEVGVELDYRHKSHIPVISIFQVRDEPDKENTLQLFMAMSHHGGCPAPFMLGRIKFGVGEEQAVDFPVDSKKLWWPRRVTHENQNSVAESQTGSYYKRIGAQTAGGSLLVSERDEVDDCLDIYGKLVQEKPELVHWERVDEATDLLDDQWSEDYNVDVYSFWE